MKYHNQPTPTPSLSSTKHVITRPGALRQLVKYRDCDCVAHSTLRISRDMKTIALCITIIAVSATLAFADLYHDGYKEGETIGCVHFESGDKITAELMTDSGMA